MKEAICFICRNIDSGIYLWDEKRGWDRYGIKVVGDRKIIDNPTKVKEDQPQDNTEASNGGNCILM